MIYCIFVVTIYNVLVYNEYQNTSRHQLFTSKYNKKISGAKPSNFGGLFKILQQFLFLYQKQLFSLSYILLLGNQVIK